MSEEYLIHYGILGQKWGVRRYQNEDGSLTEAGKQRIKKYKVTESAQLNKKYDKNIAKAETRVAVREAKGKDSTKAKAHLDSLVARKAIEQKYLDNVSIKDIRNENIALGTALTTDLLLTFGTIGLAHFTPITGGMYMIAYPNFARIQENYRRSVVGEKKLGRFEHSGMNR